MKRLFLIIIFTILSSIIYAQEFDIKPRGIEKPVPYIHTYQLNVIDYYGNPIRDAFVKYIFFDGKEIIVDSSDVTKNSGKIICKLKVSASSDIGFAKKYSSMFSYKIEKEGYYSSEGTLTLKSTSKDIANSSNNKNVILYKPDDYLKKSFLNSPKSQYLKSKILAFIDLLRIHSLISDTKIEFGEISIIQFKQNSYLTFKFSSNNIYNNIKLNRYDIGKEIFDTVIRKMLNPLNEHINDNSFYGYDIKVAISSKNFANDNAISKTTEYRFLLPRNSVIKYKNKDISGQKLLDNSIILMDDERIELKLQ